MSPCCRRALYGRMHHDREFGLLDLVRDEVSSRTAQQTLPKKIMTRTRGRDAAGIVAVQADHLDKSYLRTWAGQLQVLPELEKLLNRTIEPKRT